MRKEPFLNLVKNNVIVSCQAPLGNPLYGSETMTKMSLAAKAGGAVAIRANGKEDILAIRKHTKLPTIGIVKKDYHESDIYITPTINEVKELIETGTEVIALDATSRKRPNNESLKDLIHYIKENSDCLIMGDISTVSEGLDAIESGCDFVSTTLAGYTEYSRQLEDVDFELIKELVAYEHIVVIAEGRINSPTDAYKALQLGAHSVVVGTAITRPDVITNNFVQKVARFSNVN